MGASEQQWCCRSAGMNICESRVRALHCNRDKGIVSLRHSIDPNGHQQEHRPLPHPSTPSRRLQTNQTNRASSTHFLISRAHHHPKSEPSSLSKIRRLTLQYSTPACIRARPAALQNSMLNLPKFETCGTLFRHLIICLALPFGRPVLAVAMSTFLQDKLS